MNSYERIGRLELGPYGVFAISEDNSLSSIAKSRHPIGQDIERDYSNSLDHLKAGLRR
jgi:hypothetical protein